MKKISYTILFLFTVLLCGCTQEEDIIGAAQPLTSVTVTIGGFSSENGVETRTSDVEYATTFTQGDQIGISAITDDGVLLDDNIPYTYDGKKWAPADASKVIRNYNYAGVTYFAYYPYSTTMNGLKSEKEIINKFQPEYDQRTYANYTASDLMTGAGTITDANTDSPKMSFTLKHQMALIVVEVKNNSYVTSSGYEYNEPVGIVNVEIGGGLPYHSSTGVYKALGKPGPHEDSWQASIVFQDAIDQSIAHTYTTPWFSLYNPGKYTHVKIHNGSTPKKRDLQVGDFYYQDGSILPKDSAFYEFTVNPCIGVVFKVGAGKDDYVSNYDGKLSAIHGYAVALEEANKTWGDASQYWTGTSWYEYYGYSYTKKLLAATATGKSFPACDYCVNYRFIPTGISSGWYFPSLQQVTDFVTANTADIDNALSKCGATGISGYYISSSESSNSIDQCLEKMRGDDRVFGPKKSDGRLVRATLTF